MDYRNRRLDYPDLYLPGEKFAQVEHELEKDGIGGRIYKIDELTNFAVNPAAARAQWAQATGWAILNGCRMLGVNSPIYFCVLRSNVRNAMAIGFEDWSCIVVSDGLAAQMFFLISELSFSQYFVEYRSEHTKFQSAFKYPLMPRSVTMKHLAESRSNNNTQGALIKTLTWVGVNFIANHELAHIVNGHLGSGLVGSMLTEDRQVAEPDELQINRTIEYDADSLGIQLTLHYFLDWVGRAGESTEFLKGELDLVHTIFAGVDMAMCAIEAIQHYPLEDFHSYTHPPAIFRLWGVSSVVQNACRLLRARGLFSLSDSIIYDALDHVTRAIEWAIADRAQVAPDPETLVKAASLYGGHDAELHKCWARIRPGLEKQKLGHHKLAAAQYDLDGRPIGGNTS